MMIQFTLYGFIPKDLNLERTTKEVIEVTQINAQKGRLAEIELANQQAYNEELIYEIDCPYSEDSESDNTIIQYIDTHYL